MEEPELDESAPATWLNGLSNVGKPQLEARGDHTGAAGSLVSVIDVEGKAMIEE